MTFHDPRTCIVCKKREEQEKLDALKALGTPKPFEPRAAEDTGVPGDVWPVVNLPFDDLLGELQGLHEEKRQQYSPGDEPLANYISASQAVGMPDEFSCWLRIHEKSFRALQMIRSGRADENKEALDVSNLGLHAETLRRRRL